MANSFLLSPSAKSQSNTLAAFCFIDARKSLLRKK
jgi:hypothetical protein